MLVSGQLARDGLVAGAVDNAAGALEALSCAELRCVALRCVALRCIALRACAVWSVPASPQTNAAEFTHCFLAPGSSRADDILQV